MSNQEAFRGWLILLVLVMILPIVLHEVLPLWQFILAMVAIALMFGGGLYLGVRSKGASALTSVGQAVDGLFTALWDGLANMFDADYEEEKKGKKVRVPRPTGYWKGRLIEAVGGQCELQHCRRHRHLQVHHIHEHAKGGNNKLTNLLVVCPDHHKDCQSGGGINKTRQKTLVNRNNRFKEKDFPSRWAAANDGLGRRTSRGTGEPEYGLPWN